MKEGNYRNLYLAVKKTVSELKDISYFIVRCLGGWLEGDDRLNLCADIKNELSISGNYIYIPSHVLQFLYENLSVLTERKGRYGGVRRVRGLSY